MSTACQKDFTITVNPFGCVDWTQLLWNVPFISSANAGTSTFTPSGTTGAVFDAESTCPDSFAGDQGSNQGVATLIYNNAGCNCNLHLVLTLGADQTHECGQVLIGTTPGGNLVTVNFNSHAAGTFDFPFTLPDTLGLNRTITVIVETQTPCGGNGAGLAVHAVGTLTVV